MKKFYLVGALRPLRRYRTPVRYCWPRCAARPSRRRVASKESERRKRDRKTEGKREKGSESRSCAAISGPGRSSRRQLPSARALANVRARVSRTRRGGGSRRRALSAGRKGRQPARTFLEESFFLRSSRHAPSLRCPVVSTDREERARSEEEDGPAKEEGRDRERIVREKGEEVEW